MFLVILILLLIETKANANDPMYCSKFSISIWVSENSVNADPLWTFNTTLDISYEKSRVDDVLGLQTYIKLSNILSTPIKENYTADNLNFFVGPLSEYVYTLFINPKNPVFNTNNSVYVDSMTTNMDGNTPATFFELDYGHSSEYVPVYLPKFFRGMSIKQNSNGPYYSYDLMGQAVQYDYNFTRINRVAHTLTKCIDTSSVTFNPTFNPTLSTCKKFETNFIFYTYDHENVVCTINATIEHNSVDKNPYFEINVNYTIEDNYYQPNYTTFLGCEISSDGSCYKKLYNSEFIGNPPLFWFLEYRYEKNVTHDFYQIHKTVAGIPLLLACNSLQGICNDANSFQYYVPNSNGSYDLLTPEKSHVSAWEWSYPLDFWMSINFNLSCVEWEHIEYTTTFPTKMSEIPPTTLNTNGIGERSNLFQWLWLIFIIFFVY